MQTPSKLIVLGTGFAAFSLCKHIDTKLYSVTVISPRNHFLFTPLLPSTTVGTLEFRSIIEPIRRIRRDIQYYQAACRSIDTEKKMILCESVIEKNSFEIAFDNLIIAVGSVSNTYGIPGVADHALFLKELSDARLIRQRIIESCEQASQPGISEAERKRLLHFVVVGGGPTGVEFAAELHDFVVEDLSKPYRMLTGNTRITLLEAGDHILNSFDATLSRYTTAHFRRQKIDVRTQSFVSFIDRTTITLKDGTSIPYGLLVWSTGIGPTEFVRSLSLQKDKASRLIVNDYFQVGGFSNIYAMGDCSVVEGRNYPATSQVAQQQGKYLADSLNGKANGNAVRPFKYKHYGMLAYIGSARALADLQPMKGKGFSTFLFWRSAYLTKIVSMRNKMLVIFDWFKTLIFGRDISKF